MKMYQFVPNMPRPRNVAIIARDIRDIDQCYRVIEPMMNMQTVHDQSSTDDNDPDLLHYVFLAPDQPTIIIAPDHVTDEFVASQFDSTD